MRYMFRAECKADVVLFINEVGTQLSNFKMNSIEDIPDVEFEFETNLTIPDLNSVLMEIEDSHIMIETLMVLPPARKKVSCKCGEEVTEKMRIDLIDWAKNYRNSLAS